MGVMSELDSDLSLLRQAEDGKCYGSTTVSKTVSAGSTPAPSAIKNFRPPPFAPNTDVAEEFGRDLYAASIDPSDPDDCFRFLADLYPNRPRDVIAHADAACYCAGQIYIEAEMKKSA